MDFKEQISHYQGRVNQAIDRYLPAAGTRPALIHEAMRYSMEAGGKRLRPILVISMAETLRGTLDPEPAAVAVECLHTYSLIHDDLPSIDNSPLRRGRPTCHIQFDEATAVLAGDALLTYAFQLLSRHYTEAPQTALALIQTLSETSGSEQLIGGQVEDILTERSHDCSKDQLIFIHKNKTAALITASLLMGAHLAQADTPHLNEVAAFGFHLGLAFQVIDDILDVSGNTNDLGKPTGIDEDNEKATTVTLLGLDGARRLAEDHGKQALQHIQAIPGDTTFLQNLVHYLENRLH